MANALFGKARQSFAAAQIDWVTDDIRAIGVDSGAYTLSIDVDQFLSDIAGGARITNAVALANKTNVLGVLDADDVTLTANAATQFEYIIIYRHTGVEGTSRLIGKVDTGTGLAFTPSGSGADILVAWSNGADKILKL